MSIIESLHTIGAFIGEALYCKAALLIDKIGHGVRHEFFWLRGGIEPTGDVLLWQNERHAVVKEAELLGCGARQNGEDRDLEAFELLNAIQPGQIGHGASARLQCVFLARLRPSAGGGEMLPFVIIARGDDAAALLPGALKGGLVFCAFDTCVEDGVSAVRQGKAPLHRKDRGLVRLRARRQDGDEIRGADLARGHQRPGQAVDKLFLQRGAIRGFNIGAELRREFHIISTAHIHPPQKWGSGSGRSVSKIPVSLSMRRISSKKSVTGLPSVQSVREREISGSRRRSVPAKRS